MKYYRHGDVTVEEISLISKDLKEIETSKIVLALGEVTGHSHSVIPIGKTKLSVYSLSDEKPDTLLNDICFKVSDGNALLVHEEHEPIVLPPGIYNRKMKVQFNPFKNAVENVTD